MPEAGVGLPDLDFLLFDPNGNQIDDSGNSSGPEHVSADTTIPGTYIYRVYGWANGPTDFQIESTKLKGGARAGRAALRLGLHARRGALRLRRQRHAQLAAAGRRSRATKIEESTDGVNCAVAGTAAAARHLRASSRTSPTGRTATASAPSRRAHRQVRHDPSNVESITVARRTEVDATASLARRQSQHHVFGAGVTELDDGAQEPVVDGLLPDDEA